MYHKQLLILFVLVLVSMMVMPGGVAVAAGEELTPHENPNDAEVYYDGIAIIGYYTQLIDHVLKRASDDVEVLREKGPFANVPEALRNSLGKFGDASVNISELIIEVEADLDEMNALATQSRYEELLVLSGEVREKLIQAHAELMVIETSAGIAGEQLDVPAEDSGGPLRRAYDELEAKIDALRSLLELLQQLMNTAPGMPGTPGTPGMTLEEILALLNPTEVSLEVDPLVAFVGDPIRVEGSLKSEGIVLPYRQVVILLEGVPYAEMETGLDGKYKGAIQLPYEYVPQMKLQALYYPRDDDIGTYLASKSESVEIEMLFYTAKIELEVEGKAYPGLDTVVVGSFVYGKDPVPDMRDVEVYLDGALIAEISAGERFELSVALEPDTVLGEHRLLAIAPAQEKYAPVSAVAALDVIKLVPIIDLSPPKMAIMPFEMKVSGRVRTEDEPLEGITVQARFNDHEARTVTEEDGSFSMKLATAALNISLIGSEKLEVEAYSENPWISRNSASWKLVTLNPILISLLLVVSALILAISIRRFRSRRKKRRLQAGVMATASSMSIAEPRGMDGGEWSAGIGALIEEENDERRFILGLYIKILKLIQGVTGNALKPQTTLREFTRQSTTVLGPTYGYLDRFTRLVERLLYSRHSVKPSDVDEGRELNEMIEGAIARSDGQKRNR